MPARGEPDRRPPAAPGARDRPAGDPPDRAPRRRSAAPPVRRDARRPRTSSRANYDGLAASLLAAIEAVGGDDLARGGVRRPPAPGRAAGCASGWPSDCRPTRRLADRVRELARSRTSRATCAEIEVEPDGTIRLVEHNCAIFGVASGHAGAPARPSSSCSARSSARRSSATRHIAAGDRCCTYRVGPPGLSADHGREPAPAGRRPIRHGR